MMKLSPCFLLWLLFLYKSMINNFPFVSKATVIQDSTLLYGQLEANLFLTLG